MLLTCKGAKEPDLAHSVASLQLRLEGFQLLHNLFSGAHGFYSLPKTEHTRQIAPLDELARALYNTHAMPKPTITIEYCDECMYLKPALEAAYKILDAYADRVEAVTLKPGHDGVFRVAADGAMIIEMGDEGLPNAERVAHAVGEFLESPPRFGEGLGERSP
jgi:selenoprotein W-related protein